MRVVSLFSGAGGMDKGFEIAGFEVPWANEYDKVIWATYSLNFPHTFLNKNSIRDIRSDAVPDCDGLIGGPPCQSWSLAGSMKGINDPRGKLFYEYLRILEAKKPKFFVAENVPGIKSRSHVAEYEKIVTFLNDAGYNATGHDVNASDYGVPQDRKRVIIVGYRLDLGKEFSMPPPVRPSKTLRDAIFGWPESIPAREKNKANRPADLFLPSHEHMTGSYSSHYMSRNRVRGWDEPSFTILASGRHAPQHPSTPPMIFKEKDKFEFQKTGCCRRLSVRECAKIQTFPDDFIFSYTNLADAYKMIGNAVPVELAKAIATKIKEDLE